MVSSEGEHGWLIETIRATQETISESTSEAEIGSSLPDALVEPSVNRVAWIGQPHSEGVRIKSSSHSLPGEIELATEVRSRTSAAADSGTVQIEAADPEYAYLTEEADLPAVETTVAIPLGTEAASVLHLYTDGTMGSDAADHFAAVGDMVATGFERAALSRELDRERDRLESLRSLVSHDLGNPLNLAAGRLDLVSMECDSEHIEHVERGLEQIQGLADEGSKFVTVGRTVTEREQLSLAAIAEDCWEYASRDRGTLTVEDVTVTAEPERLRRILNELFLNVFIYTDGEVHVDVGPLSDGGGFYVADDGPGIPVDERDYVFDRGYSTDSERDGNGLAVVEEIAQAHGWEVRLAESDGTRVEVRTDRW